MNDFLEQVWENNTIKSYFIAAAVILLVLILKKIISRYLAGLLFRLVNKIWKDVEKKSFTSLLVQPLSFSLLILVSIVALYRLNFPDDLNIELYGYTVKEIFHCAGTIILIVSFVWLLLRVIDFVAIILERKADLTPEMTDNQLVVFFRDFFKVLIVIIGVLMVLSFAFGFHISSLITGLSIVGAAVALALKESLENLIASFIIFFDKPFTTGDLVKVHNITGTVEKIGLRSTRIRSDQKTYVTVPNKQMVDSILDNLSLRTQRRADLKLELDLKTSSSKLESLLAGVKKIMERKEIEDANVFLGEITGNSFVLQSDYYTIHAGIEEFNNIKEQVNLQILKLMEELQIEIAGANTDVRVNK